MAYYNESYLSNTPTFRKLAIVGFSGLALIALYVFVLMNIRLPYLIETRFLTKVGFSVFFTDEEGMSVAFKVALSIAVIAGVLVAAGGFFTEEYEWIAYGLIGGGLSILALRLVIAILGYVIWLIFSPVMVILLIITMLVFFIIFGKQLRGAKGKTGASFFIIFTLLISVAFCIIGFRFNAGDTIEMVLVRVLRVFLY